MLIGLSDLSRTVFGMPSKPFKHACSKCGKTFLKWQGICSSCGAAGTINTLEPRAASTETPERKTIRRRWQTRERDKARRMTTVDGHDPAFKHIASSTGKVGMITGMRIDAVSMSYVTEIKNRVLPGWLNDAWLLINQRSIDFGKNALLHLDPPNKAKDFVLNGTKYKLGPMEVITETRHEDLIRIEKKLSAIENVIISGESNVVRIRKITDILES